MEFAQNNHPTLLFGPTCLFGTLEYLPNLLFRAYLPDKHLKGLTIVEGQIPKRKRFLTFETADSVVTAAWRGWRRVGFMQEIPNFSFNTRYCY